MHQSVRREGRHKATSPLARRWSRWGRWVTVTTGAGLTALASVATVLAYWQTHDAGPPRYVADLTGRTQAREFAELLAQNDSRTVYLDVECGSTDVDHRLPDSFPADARCFFDPFDSQGQTVDQLVLPLGELGAVAFWQGGATSDQENRRSVWIKFDLGDGTGARVFNSRGAGWIEAKGYFVVTKVAWQDAPPGAAGYSLQAVRPTAS